MLIDKAKLEDTQKVVRAMTKLPERVRWYIVGYMEGALSTVEKQPCANESTYPQRSA